VSDVSLAGMFPMCGGWSTHLRMMFFLRSIAPIHTLQTSVSVEINRGQLMPYADDGEES
jgi:hypothetical protein